MSIFGSFDELPFPDVVSMLERRVGHLRVWNVSEGKRYTLHLNKGRLQALQVDTTWFRDMFELRETIISMMQASQGKFEFERCASSELATDFDRPMHLLLLSASTAIDEINLYRHHFADARTRFSVVGNLDTWADHHLQHFWQHGQTALVQGASAKELALSLGLSLEDVQLCLYKLRTLGVVAPVQEFRQRAQQRRRAAQRSAQRTSQPQQPMPHPSTKHQPSQLATIQASTHLPPDKSSVNKTPADKMTDLTDEFADLIAWADELDQKSTPPPNPLLVQAEPASAPQPASVVSAEQSPRYQPRLQVDSQQVDSQQVDNQQTAPSQHSDRQETMIQRMLRALSFGKRS